MLILQQLAFDALGTVESFDTVWPMHAARLFTVNGQLRPTITMRPGEVQLWRIVNTSSRNFAKFLAPTSGFEWKQLAQDGVQFADVNYQKSHNLPFVLAPGAPVMPRVVERKG